MRRPGQHRPVTSRSLVPRELESRPPGSAKEGLAKPNFAAAPMRTLLAGHPLRYVVDLQRLEHVHTGSQPHEGIRRLVREVPGAARDTAAAGRASPWSVASGRALSQARHQAPVLAGLIFLASHPLLDRRYQNANLCYPIAIFVTIKERKKGNLLFFGRNYPTNLHSIIVNNHTNNAKIAMKSTNMTQKPQ